MIGQLGQQIEWWGVQLPLPLIGCSWCGHIFTEDEFDAHNCPPLEAELNRRYLQAMGIETEGSA